MHGVPRRGKATQGFLDYMTKDERNEMISDLNDTIDEYAQQDRQYKKRVGQAAAARKIDEDAQRL